MVVHLFLHYRPAFQAATTFTCLIQEQQALGIAPISPTDDRPQPRSNSEGTFLLAGRRPARYPR